MIIERITVDEGFLDGLDLEFSDGLNVLIGSRGAGKTSIIELIRFCLGVPAITESQDAAAQAHALAVLGSGRVTVTIRENGERTKISRTADDAYISSDVIPALPLIVSQNEIEEIGLQAASRLQLIDRFVTDVDDDGELPSQITAVRSFTNQAASLRAEIARLTAESASISDVQQKLTDLTKQQAELGKALSATKPEQLKLEELSARIGAARLRQHAIDSSLMVVKSWKDEIAELVVLDTGIEPWPHGAGPDVLGEARAEFEQLNRTVKTVEANAKALIAKVERLAVTNRKQLADLDDEARALRKRLEGVQKGAGEIQKNIAYLQSQLMKVQAVSATVSTKKAQLQKLLERRDQILDSVEDQRVLRFKSRALIVERLNRELGPEVMLRVEHQARHDQYTSAIAAALRGSGLKYNVWASKIARAVTPREFVKAVESGETDLLVQSVDRLNYETAAKLVAGTDAENLASILVSDIEDNIDFSLLDGGEYKDSANLSTGQRCTVVLPILLRQSTEPLVIDQPEDHLDNAFIVNTLVKGMVARKATTQIICSTHNANIPVLGAAERVILLGSDGSRAFVQSAAELEDERSVRAITSIMEGGLEAFRRRADFYRSQFA